MVKLKDLMELLEVSEADAIKAILNLVSPPPPPATRQNWSRQSTFGHSAPSTKELWKKLVESDFRCHRCRSQMRLSFNHINGNAADHRLDNLEVICFACNRFMSQKGTKDVDHHYKLAMTSIDLWKASHKFPSLNEIKNEAGVAQIGGATYLLKFIEQRLSNKMMPVGVSDAVVMSSEQERKEVFAWFGAASYYAQCVEVELWIARLFMIYKQQDPWPDEHEWSRIESKWHTMGTLMKLVDQGIGLMQTELEDLRVCCEKRNWLSHKYWEQRDHFLVSSEGCRRAVDELAELCEVFKSGDLIAEGISARIRSEVGISEQLIRELQNEYAERLRSGELHETILKDLGERIERQSIHESSCK